MTSISSPSSVGAAELMTVTCTVTNVGNETATVSSGVNMGSGWPTTLCISPDDTWDSATYLNTEWHGDVTPIAPGESYLSTFTGACPLLPEGNYYLKAGLDFYYVRADGTYGCPERAHGFYSSPIYVENPDLTVTNINAPDIMTPGQQFNISFTVKNQGDSTASPQAHFWMDSVYISTDNQFNESDILWLENQKQGPLNPNDYYTYTTWTLTTPDILSTGNYYLIVRTNSHFGESRWGVFNYVYESVLDNNIMVKPFTIAIDVFNGDNIQTTINNATNGTTILIHGDNGNPTTYTENITINKNVKLKSAGDGEVIIRAANTSLPVILITSSGSGSTIQGLTITGSSSGSGINLESASNCLVSGNTIFGNSVGIKLYNSNANVFVSNHIHDNGWAGICLDQSSGNTIHLSNTFTANQAGVFMANNSNNNLVQGNVVSYNTGIGISILNSSTGNTIDSTWTIYNGVMGVFIQNSNNNTISCNGIQNNTWTGICLDNADNNTINRSNEISNNGEGIFLANGSTGNTIQANNIHDNTGTGISILGGSNNNIIRANTAITHNGVMGVFIQNSDYNQVLGDPTSGNDIQLNGWAGICLDHASHNVISKTSASAYYNVVGRGQEGIFLANNSNYNTISNCYINSNTGNGVNILNSSNNTIEYNPQIISNCVSGIFIQKSTNTIIHQNLMNNNIWGGVILDTATNTTVYQNNINNSPQQTLAVNGTGNKFHQDNTGNYYNNWTTNNPRPIDGNENLYDQYPSTTPFYIV